MPLHEVIKMVIETLLASVSIFLASGHHESGAFATAVSIYTWAKPLIDITHTAITAAGTHIARSVWQLATSRTHIRMNSVHAAEARHAV